MVNQARLDRRLAALAALLMVSWLAVAPSHAAGDYEPVGGVRFDQGRPHFDWRTWRWFTHNRIANVSGGTLSGAFRLVVTDSRLPVANADGTTAQGEPYLLLGHGERIDFGPGQTIVHRIEFQPKWGRGWRFRGRFLHYGLRLERMVAPPDGEGGYRTVTDIGFEKRRFSFRWRTRLLTIEHRLENQGSEPVVGPFRLVVEAPTLPVANADGETASGEPFLTLVDGDAIRLLPGDHLDGIAIRFRIRRPWDFFRLRYRLRLEQEIGPPTPDNAPPVAHAGPDQTRRPGGTVFLDGHRSSDGDGDELSYLWRLAERPPDSAVGLSNPEAFAPTFLPDVEGDYVLDLTVGDGEAESEPDRVVVSTANSAPVAEAGPGRAAGVGEEVVLDASGSSDVDGDPLAYLWRIESAPEQSNASLPDPEAVRPVLTVDAAGEYVLHLIVSDGFMDSEPDRVIVTDENLPPLAEAGPDQAAIAGTRIALDGSASQDPEGGALEYRWSVLAKPEASNAHIKEPTAIAPSFELDRAGEYVIQLIVNDGTQDSEADQLLVSTDNVRPVADAGSVGDAQQGDTVELDGSGSADADDDPLNFRWALMRRPAGSAARLSDSRTANPTFDADIAGLFIAQLIVDDGELDSEPDTVAVGVEERPNEDPVIESTPSTTAEAGEQFTYAVVASDPDGDPLRYSLEFAPATMTIDSAGLLEWTPESAGTVSVTLKVDDGRGGAARQSFDIEVAPANRDPEITSTPVTEAVTGQQYAYTVDAEDADGDPLTFGLNVAPEGMRIGADSGKITWTPEAAGTVAVTVEVVDGEGGSATQAFEIAVEQANRAPTITSAPPIETVVGGQYRYDVDADDPDGDALTFVLTQAPAGMSIDAASGSISWTPDAEGNFAVAVRVTDGRGGADSQSFTLSVGPPPNEPPVINSMPGTAATIDQTYTYAVVAEDPNGDPLTYSLVESPLGMKLGDSGVVSWTPRADGTHAVELLVRDGRGGADGQAFTLSVTGEDARAPRLESPGNRTMPLGQTHSFRLVASDPDGDILRFFAEPVPLPANMALDSGSGVFTFTPALDQVGTHVLTFTASDGRFSDRETVTITVPPPPGVTSLRGQVLTINDQPLPGVRLQIAGVQTRTDANGFYHLQDVPVAGHVRLLVDGSTVDPARGVFATVPEMIRLVAGADNVLSPPIFLLPLDADSADPVDPDQTSVVTSSRLIDDLRLSEPVTLTIPPSAAMDDASGEPYEGDIHISFVTDPSKGPRPLPEEFDLSVYIAIQPFGVTYPEPVPISFPNLEGFPPGTRLDFFALNHETGEMEKIGEGLVSDDGKTVDSIGGVVKSNSWHGIVPQGPVVGVDGATDQSEPGKDCSGVDGGCRIDKETGNLTEWHDLPGYRSLQKDRTLALQYNSNNANPTPILPVSSGFGNQAPPPEAMSMRMTVGGVQIGRELFSEVTVEPSGVPGQFKTTRPALQFDAASLSTGIHDYVLEVDCYFPVSRRLQRMPGQIIVRNESASAFGAGWNLVGLQRVHDHGGGNVVVTAGTATSLLFEGNGDGSFESPAGDFSTLTRRADGTLERRMKDGTLHRFNADGRMVEKTDRNGNTTVYDYDAAGRLVRIADPVSSAYVLTYHAGRIASISDPLNRTTRFEHDSAGNLIAIIEPNGDRRAFEYDPGKHLMTAQIDQRGNRTQYFYDHADRIESTLLPDGSRPEFTVADTLGLIDTTQHEATRESPAPGPPLDEDIQNRYIDHNGNERVAESDARDIPTTLHDAVGREFRFTRDADSNPVETTRPNGSEIARTFDDRGNVLTRIERFNNATERFAWDEHSLLISYTNPNNHTTVLNRDAAGNIESVVNPLGHTTTFQYDSRGLVTRMTTPNLLAVAYTYNSQGLVETVTETPPTGSPGQARVTRFDYDTAGQTTRVVTPAGVTLDLGYDLKGRVTRISDNLGQSIEYAYDAHDNLVRADTRDSGGDLALTVSRAFDTRNRVAEIRAPHEGAQDSVIQRVLDSNSNITDRVDPRGNDLHNTFDAEDRLIENRHRLDGITEYEYDTNDRVVQVTAPNGATTTFRHDPLGRRLAENSPDRGELHFTYDRANNVTTLTDARGITSNFAYDDLERITSRRYPNSIPGKIEDVAYEYDNCPFGTGRLCRRTDEGGTWEYEYDAFGNIVRETRTTLGVAYTTEYGYDGDDNLTRIVYPSGRLVSIDRDGVRRPQAIRAEVNGSEQTLVSNMQYRGDDRLRQASFGNGLVDDRAYDLQGRLVEQALGSIDSRRYRYDANGNLIDRTTTPQDSAYGYDALDRLVSDTIDGAMPFEYRYDLNHNRQAKTRTGPGDTLAEDYAYRSGTNRLDRVAAVSATPLALEPRHRQLRYNDANRLFQVIDDSALRAEYVYNDAGQRTRKTVFEADGTSTVTVYHYDLQGRLIAETDAAGAPIRDYVWSDGLRPVAQIDATAGGERVLYLHTDHLLTPRLATNSVGQVVWRWEGEAFGSTEVAEGFSVEVNLRFPGQYFDEETGLHQNWWRTYDPAVGRYLRGDPIGFSSGSINPYRYAASNPFRFTDSNGQVVQILVGATIGGVSGVLGALITGGGLEEALIGAGVGIATGALTAALPGGATLAAALIRGGGIAGIGNAAGQAASIVPDPCKSIPEDFNVGAFAGSIAGGSVAGAFSLGAVGTGLAGQLGTAGQSAVLEAAATGLGERLGAR